MRRTAGRRVAVSVLAALCAATLAACTSSGSPAPSSSASGHGATSTSYLAPNGSGDCSAAKPCGSLSSAIARAGNGGTVEVAAGSYPAQEITAVSGSADRTKDVTVQGSTTGTATFESLRVAVSHVRFRHISATGAVYLTDTADHVTLEDVHVHGASATVIIHASNVLVADSLIEGGHAKDGIQIANQPRNHDIEIRHNVIRDFSPATFQQQHPDCIQIFDSERITVTQNSLYDCYNSAMTFSTGANLGVGAVTIEGNYMQGCLAARQRCGAGSVLDLRNPVSQALVSHNTFGHGSLRLPVQSGISAPANIVSYLSLTGQCDNTALTDSLILDYTSYICPSGVPRQGDGNWTGAVTFKDPTVNDLQIVGSLPAAPNGRVESPAGQGFSQHMSAGTVGAS